MDLKALGLRFALGYLMSRAAGNSQKNAAVDSLFGSTIAQAEEDITGFTPEIAEVTTLVVEDLISGRRAQATGVISHDKSINRHEVDVFNDNVHNSEVGLTLPEVEAEVAQIKDGLDEAVSTLSRLERLQAGVLKKL